MVKKLLLCACLVFIIGVKAQALIIEHPLDVPPKYVRDIGPIFLEEHSLVEVYVENILDETRWKDWIFKIWVSESGPDLTTMEVRYDLTSDHSSPIASFPVDLAELTEPPPIAGYKGVYASTFEAPWEELGTTVPGGGGLYDIGNPWWVSFHFDVPEPYDDFVVYSIHDECIPEPATLCLLGVGGLVLKRKRKV